jgi:L-lactate dehydrogenase complex protein LldG
VSDRHTARDAILARVRRGSAHRVAHPDAFEPAALPGDWNSFAAVLRSVGAEPVGPVPRPELDRVVRAQIERRSSGGRVVADPGAHALLGAGPWEEVTDASSPHGLADVAVSIALGSIGVAENAAVGVDGRHGGVRAMLFLAEHLILLLDARALAPDMHAATARLPADATAHYHYTWISGPSKTADIEQTLVLGAHGPRSLAVVGIG